MYAVEAAIIKMYNVFKEDVDTVRPYQKEIGEKMLKNRGMLLTTDILLKFFKKTVAFLKRLVYKHKKV